MTACAACGEDNPERAKFCLNCGAPLGAEPPSLRKMRKTVTVVFADVTGSTALGERLDPESLQDVMERYFGELRMVLEHHGGTVEKFIGDAVMAVFGIPTLHEDDALRAVRAAVGMREALAVLNEELARERGVEIAARIGVNTGEVMAGDPSRGEAFATGDAVNLAARLEQAAQPGEILIGDSTQRLVRDAVTVESIAPLELKGKSRGVDAYRLLAVEPGAPAHVRRLDSPMVGRDRERKLLYGAFERVTDDSTSHLFTILGPAGVGKSRLVEDFVQGLGTQAAVVRGRCLPYGEAITYWPVAEVVKEAAGLDDSEPPERARERIVGLLDDEEHAELIGTRVASLIGLAEETGSGTEESFWAVRKLLESLARRRPLVVVLDDIHWAEPTFLDLVEHIADWSRDAPILLVCLARPELLDDRPGWGGGKLNASSILLEPLSEAEAGRLIENLLGQAALEEAVRDRINEAAEGNPLFVEEMLEMLIDDGLLQRLNGSWSATSDLTGVPVPPTIHALLAARLDRLEPDERAVIERGSVEGKVFHRSAVLELAPETLRPTVGTHLMTLLRKELIRPDRASFAGEDAFRFRHLVIRDAAYDALPKETRADLHERFAGWLERKAGERLGEYDEILGYHLEQAYRCRADLGPVDEHGRELAALASARLETAGRRATARGDVSAGAKLLDRALRLKPAGSGERLELLVELADALYHSASLVRADDLVAEAIETARAVGDRRLELYALLERTMIRSATDPEGQTDEQFRVAEEAIPVFERLEDSAGLARAWTAIGYGHHMRAQFALRSEAFERALDHARRAGDQAQAAELLRVLGVSWTFGPLHVDEAIRKCEEALAQVRGNPRSEASFLGLLGPLHAMRGEFDRARAAIARARAFFEEFSLLVGMMFLAESSWNVEMLAGNPAVAEQVTRRGYEALERAGEKGWLSTNAAELAQSLFALGRDEEAAHFTRVSEELGASDDLATQVMWRQVRAKVLARSGDLGPAERLAREAVRLSEEGDSPNWRGDALLDLAEVLRLAGRPAEAVAPVESALRLYEQKGNVVSAARARTLLEELSASAPAP